MKVFLLKGKVPLVSYVWVWYHAGVSMYSGTGSTPSEALYLLDKGENLKMDIYQDFIRFVFMPLHIRSFEITEFEPVQNFNELYNNYPELFI